MKRIIKAFVYSMAGLKATWQNETAFKQEVILSAILLPLIFWLTNDVIERVILIMPIFLVLIVEILNSAIEACIDRIGAEIHPLSKQAKDMGSAAVWLSLLLVVIVWSIILIK
ncbi:Diacylglycerol kinase [hydrothermal vent metagenome]|uniref:Diacylglycerol kinase n=1 Tax=hydrothermal vent metagenome TaxID=652676 RepID=A0A1W1CG77_9ZZZZ